MNFFDGNATGCGGFGMNNLWLLLLLCCCGNGGCICDILPLLIILNCCCQGKNNPNCGCN